MTVTAQSITIGERTIVLRPRVCPACADAAVLFQPDSTPPKSKWQRLCPPLYQRDLPPALQRQPWVADVVSWRYGPQGLLVVGNTGTGKTWVMWQLLRRLLEEQRGVAVLDAVTYRSGLANAAREGETEIYVQRLACAEVLYWDDFGQTHLSGAASEMLLHLVEQRTSHERPLLLTSQYSGGALESQFQRPEMGGQFGGGLMSFAELSGLIKSLLNLISVDMYHIGTCNAFGHNRRIGVECENGRKKVQLDTPTAWPVQGGAGAAARGIPSERLPLYLGWSTPACWAGHAWVVVPGSHGGIVGGANRTGQRADAKSEVGNGTRKKPQKFSCNCNIKLHI